MENREVIVNLESQTEELLALQSIYDESILVIDQDVHPPSGRFLIRPKLPHPFHLTYNINPKCPDGKIELVSECKAVIIEYLPPLVLYFELPNTYPTQTGPAFMLVCKWLTLEQLSCLCKKLDNLWEESGRDVILFCWVQFLQEESLRFLGISNSLDISYLILFNRQEHIHCSTKEKFLKEKDSGDSSTCQVQQESKNNFLTDKNERLPETHADNQSHSEGIDSNQTLHNPNYVKSSVNCSAGSLYDNENSPKSARKAKNRSFNKKCGNSKELCSKNTYRCLQNSNQAVSHKFQRYNYEKVSEKISSAKQDTFSSAVDKEDTKLKSQNVKGNLTSYKNKYSHEESMFKPCVHRGKGHYDQRAVLDLHTGRTLLSSLAEYNQLQKQEAFNNEWFTCKVCFTQKQGSQFIQFHGCNHLFCQECMCSYFEIQIRDGSSHSLICPEEKCTSQALPSQVKELVSADLYARYDSSLLATTLDSMSDIRYCPRSHCNCATIVEPNSKMALCPSCGFAFCVYCKMVYHGVEPCRFKAEERKQIRDSYMQADKEEKAKMEQRYGRCVLQILVDEILSEEWISSYSKKCPHCNASIEKIDGCNKMSCWRCGAYFCWLCMQRLPQTNPYHHFNDPVSDCFNRLFQGVL